MTMNAPVLVIGSGFAALAALRELRRRDRQLPITLVAPTPRFVYSPSLIWVPTDLRSSSELELDLTPELQRLRVDFVAARVTGLDPGSRQLLTDQGPLAHSGLIIASGARHLRQLPGIEHSIALCDGPAAANELRQRLHALQGGTLAFGMAGNPAEPGAMRGGPMFELLFGVDTWLRRQGYRTRFELVFFAPMARPGQRLGDAAVNTLLAEMNRRQITPRLGQPLQGFARREVRTAGGCFSAELIAFLPGLCGPDWAAASGLPLSPGGFFVADAHGRCTAGAEAGGAPIYVAGDSGSYPGPDWLPKQAHMAELQARAAAANLLAERAGRPAYALARPELLCIVDSLDGGTLIYRSPKRQWVWQHRWLHTAKRLFEWQYLRRLRA